MGSVLTGGLNGTMTGAAGQTGRSEGEMQRQNVKNLSVYVGSGMTDNLLPVQDSVQHAGEEADFLSGYSMAAADEQRRSDARRTAGLGRKKQDKMFGLHSDPEFGTEMNRPVLGQFF